MASCCGPDDPDRYDEVFDEEFARSVARRYRRNGLTPVERRIVDYVTSTGIAGASVLEVGGGVGELQRELLARGASRTVNLELSSAYEADARRLVEHAGVSGRVTRILGVDLAREPDSVDDADVVLLHRVVCCYPDAERLLGAAADRARHMVVFSHPPRSLLSRATVAAGNLMLRLRGRSYRGFVHEPAAMVAVLRRHGLEPRYRHRGLIWCVVGATRS
ncbi:class I SAM-dependent methyltransferase [Agromyces ramosus]|uniref:16S rRNA G966 N2-methylase RsmD n=1 Tax=Agromyces ramosus TaxID=33879 RepID=A0ABU0RD71_9MICO|nr:methyltransferase domain-containing protein [Agromyces ramosus]MDQ0896018.1 16S rRNA G966 N2-methylase RsmD [Agromyces ramosus]